MRLIAAVSRVVCLINTLQIYNRFHSRAGGNTVLMALMNIENCKYLADTPCVNTQQKRLKITNHNMLAR